MKLLWDNTVQFLQKLYPQREKFAKDLEVIRNYCSVLAREKKKERI